MYHTIAGRCLQVHAWAAEDLAWTFTVISLWNEFVAQEDYGCQVRYTEVSSMTVANLSQEFVGCRFGDARLTNRIKKLADQTAQKPNPSIPSALISKADIEGCYRFFDNDSVTPERILQPHIARTYQRMVEADLRTLKALLEGSQA